MNEKCRVLNKHLKAFDSSLSCQRIPNNGALGVYQKTDSGTHLVLPLTENWTFHARPCDWGIEPVLSKLRFGHPSRNVVEELIQEEERAREREARYRKGEQEAFLKDFRPAFAKMTDGINTSTMEKKDLRRNHAYRK